MKILVIGTRKHEGKMLGCLQSQLPGARIEFIRSIERIEMTEDCDVVLVSQEWKPATRIALYQLKKKNVPVIYLVDGVIEWDYVWNNQSFVHPEKATVFQPLIADYICVLGRHQARILAALGLSDRIRIVGMPRHDITNFSRLVDPSVLPRVVVTTAKTFGHNVAHEILVKQALSDLIEYFSRNKNVLPIWRLSAELHDEFGLASSKDVPVEDVLRTSNAVISFPSTVFIEGMKFGLPTALIDYRSNPQYLQAAWSISSKCHIEPVIQELLNPPASKLAYQSACLEDELEPGKNSSSRLADVINEAVSNFGGEVTGVDVNASFRGAMDYRLVHPQISSFSIRELSVAQYQLDAAYRYQSLYRKLVNTAPFRFVAKIVKVFGALPGFRKSRRILEEIEKM